MNFENARKLMVENQLRPNKITDPKIISIFNEIKKEDYLSVELHSLAYSDSNISLLKNRGYLNNLHVAQLIQHAKISNKESVLHIGGLTGYVSTILSKIACKVVVVENDDEFIELLNNNIKKFQIKNIEIIKNELHLGYYTKSPYDIIFIDCPLEELSKEIKDQIKPNLGRIIMIEKIKDNLSKAIKITNNNKEILFDVFCKFTLYPNSKKFIF